MDATEYKVIEILQPPYVNISPLVQTVVADQQQIFVAFGNVALQIHHGLGRTRGFWGASPRSLDLYDAAFPAWAERINSLLLVDNNGDRLLLSTTDAAQARDDMRAWFTSQGPSNNRAHQLSVQLAASVLNVYAGAMSSAPGVFVQCRGKLRNIEDVFDMAGVLIDENPVVQGNHAIAARMGYFKDLFENLNDNTDPVHLVLPGPVPTIQARITPRRR
jgi:hypothetical protein